MAGPSLLDRVRAALHRGQAAEALALCTSAHTDGGPADAWARALAAAAAGSPLQARIALRAATRDGPLPEGALADVARPFALAVLTGDAEAATGWRVLAGPLHGALTEDAAPTDVHAAWNLLLAAADAAAPDDRHRWVVLLGLLQLHRGDAAAATPLLRAAQDGAARRRDAPVWRDATLALARVCRLDGEPELAQDVVRHGTRRLRDWGDTEAAASLEYAWSDLVQRSVGGPDPASPW